MTTVRRQVLWSALIVALVAGSWAFVGSEDAASPDGALVLADEPTLDVSRAADGAILIRDATRGGADSKVTIVRDAETGALIVREPVSALRSTLATVGSDGALRLDGAGEAPLRVELGAGDDTLIADCSGGAFHRGIDYAGGDGFDVLEVEGAGTASMRHIALTRNDGAVVCAGMRIDYVELEPITLTGAGGSLTVDFTFTTSVNVALADFGPPGDGVSIVTADNGAEDAIFSGFDSLTIRGGPADNVIDLVGVDSAATLTSVTVEGLDGDDTLNVDLSGTLAAFLLTGSLAYDGGLNTSVGDSLIVSGGSFTDVDHTATNASDGTIDLDGGTITYTGLEPILDAVVATNRSFTFSAASETIVLSTGSIVGDGLNLIDSTAAESVTFAPPTTSLFVDCGAGADDLTVSALEGGPPVPYSVLVAGGAGSDALTYSGPCAATIIPTSPDTGSITELGVMTVGYAEFESVQTDPPATMNCTLARSLLWPPRGGLYPVAFSAVPGGACDSTVTVTVYANETGTGFTPDAVATGGVLRLRAERDYPGSGRVYLVVAEVAGQAFDCCTCVVPTIPVGFAILQARMAADGAETFCLANGGSAPAGFTQILQYTVP